MTDKLQTLKNVKILEQNLTIKSALSTGDAEAVDAFADAVANSSF